MKNVVFADGTKIECTNFEEGPFFYDGYNRRCITIQMPAAATTFDKLDRLLSDADNLQRIILRNDAVVTGYDDNGDTVLGEAQDVFDGYTIRTDLAKRPIAVQQADGTDLWQECFVVQLAKKPPRSWNWMPSRLHLQRPG